MNQPATPPGGSGPTDSAPGDSAGGVGQPREGSLFAPPPAPNPNQRRFRLTVEYDGTPFRGWQRQEGVPSVQGALEEALARICGHPVLVEGAGRTDAGVHARGQVAHFDTTTPRPPLVLLRAINANTPPEVNVSAVEPVPGEFHARFSARAREYHYLVLNRPAPPALERLRVWHRPLPLDRPAMARALRTLEGTHDFSAFRAAACQAKSPIRTVLRARLSEEGELLRIVLGADAFLHHMVRNIVGSLLLVGRGTWTPQRFAEVLASRDRTLAGPTAPACGLYLVRVFY